MSTFTTSVLIMASIYGIVMLSIGVYLFKEGIDTFDDYITAGRQAGGGFPMAIVAASLLATNNGNANVLGLPELGFDGGFGNVFWLVTGVVLVYSTMIYVGPKLYDTAASTLPDIAYSLYGSQRMRYIVTVWGVLRSLFFLAVELYGTAIVIQFIFGVPWQQVLIPAAIVITLYTVLGGIPAVGVSDIIQWSIIVIGTSAMIPVLFFTEGDFTTFVASNAPENFAAISPTLGVVELFALTLGAALWVYTDPSFVQRFLSARDRTSARRGAIGWILIIYPWWVLMGIIGVYGHAIAPGADSQTILIAVTQGAFPAIIAAIVVTAVFAGTMSTADSQMNVISAMLINDVYMEFRPDMSDKHYLRMARAATVLAGGAGVLMAPIFAESILVMSLNLQMIFISGTVPTIIVALLWGGVPERAGFYSSLLGGGIALGWIIQYGTDGLMIRGIGVQAVYPGMIVALILVFGLTFIIGRKPDNGSREVVET